jgi:hypothetical protein
MLDPTTRASLEPVIVLLDRLGIDYYIGGSLASIAYGEPRATMDANVVALLEESHAESIRAELCEGFYVDVAQIRDAIGRQSSFNLISLSTSFKVDVFVPRDSPYCRNEFLRRIRLQIAADPDLFAWFASAEDILLHKLQWYRRGDGVSDQQWRDILGILKVQMDALDASYLAKWAQELGVADLLERARTSAGF